MNRVAWVFNRVRNISRLVVAVTFFAVGWFAHFSASVVGGLLP